MIMTFGGAPKSMHLKRNNDRYGNRQRPLAEEVGFVLADQLRGKSTHMDYSIYGVHHIWTKK